MQEGSMAVSQQARADMIHCVFSVQVVLLSSNGHMGLAPISKEQHENHIRGCHCQICSETANYLDTRTSRVGDLAFAIRLFHENRLDMRPLFIVHQQRLKRALNSPCTEEVDLLNAEALAANEALYEIIFEMESERPHSL